MLKLNQIGYDVAEARLQYCWDILKSHGRAQGELPPSSFTSSTSINSTVRFMQKFAAPEELDIRKEVYGGLTTLRDIVTGNHPHKLIKKTYAGRSFVVQTDHGPLDAGLCALEGVLTQRVYEELELQPVGVEGEYNIGTLAKRLGCNDVSLRNKVDKEKMQVLGRYSISHLDARGNPQFNTGTVERMVRDLNQRIFVSGFIEYVHEKYGVKKAALRNIVKQIIRNPQEVIQSDDPMYNFDFEFTNVFARTIGINLRTVNALAHVMRRDARIMETHVQSPEMAIKLGLQAHTAVSELAIEGTIGRRRTSILYQGHPNQARAFYFCDDDVKSYAAKKAKTVTIGELQEALKAKGMGRDRGYVVATLHENGFIPANVRGKQGCLTPSQLEQAIAIFEDENPLPVTKLSKILKGKGVLNNCSHLGPFLHAHGYFDHTNTTRPTVKQGMIPQLVAHLRREGKFAKAYMTFCKINKLDKATAWEQYEAHYKAQHEAKA